MGRKIEEEKSCCESKCDGVLGLDAGRSLNKILKKRENGDVISNLYPFYQSKIRIGLEPFYEEYAQEFDPDESENKLIYWDIFRKFEELFEGFLEEFIESQNLDKSEFYQELEQCCESPSKKSNVLVKLVAAQTDFEFFVGIMKDKARELESTTKERRSNHK